MTRTSISQASQKALNLAESIQKNFGNDLTGIENNKGEATGFYKIYWQRNRGLNGGGHRLVAKNQRVFNRASINVSQIHYGHNSEKKLVTATALSTIIHPQHPHAPSLHLHLSWTELKSGENYWRIMTDLNPAICIPEHVNKFRTAIHQQTENCFAMGTSQGDQYFYIPALNRHRGAFHFYLEQYSTTNAETDYLLAKNLGIAAVKCYFSIVQAANSIKANLNDYQKQLNYHTLYFYQVLTLDRGTTSGLLVHNENDVGILGSLPGQINPDILKSWLKYTPSPQRALVTNIIAKLPNVNPCPIDDQLKIELAKVIRFHYAEFPNALKSLAQGNHIPPTVENQQSKN